MRDLDEVDREILDLLLSDARRPYSDIAERVDLSPPAVSDRIERLEELGVIRRFTLDLDRSMLEEGVPVLVELDVQPGATDAIRTSLTSLDAVEHVFVTAEGDVVFQARIADTDVTSFLRDSIDTTRLDDVSVRLLSSSEWRPAIGDVSLALTCAECENRVTAEGESAVIDGKRYHFCCENCLEKFETRFEELQSGA
jgi:DNA-binding Lrp family transcriptional regulator